MVLVWVSKDLYDGMRENISILNLYLIKTLLRLPVEIYSNYKVDSSQVNLLRELMNTGCDSEVCGTICVSNIPRGVRRVCLFSGVDTSVIHQLFTLFSIRSEDI